MGQAMASEELLGVLGDVLELGEEIQIGLGPLLHAVQGEAAMLFWRGNSSSLSMSGEEQHAWGLMPRSSSSSVSDLFYREWSESRATSHRLRGSWSWSGKESWASVESWSVSETASLEVETVL